MYEKILIVSGGSIDDSFAAEWLEEAAPDYLIAADSGMEFFYRVGKLPDMIIGDFDSVKPEVLDFFKKKAEILIKELNPIKDDTDTEFAIRQAIALGAKEITILGGTGSRLDHVLGNIALLGIGLMEQASIFLVDKNNRIRMIDKPLKLSKTEQFGSYVSLIPYHGEVEHLYLKGFKYPLEDFCLKAFNSLGISNEIAAATAEISFSKGILLVIEARDEK